MYSQSEFNADVAHVEEMRHIYNEQQPGSGDTFALRWLKPLQENHPERWEVYQELKKEGQS